MKGSANSSRDKFRRLAVVDIDPAGILGLERDSDYLRCLLRVIRAADAIFWRQVAPCIDYQLLLQQAGVDHELKELLLFNHGPYDRLANNAPFLPVPPRSPGGGFYPADLTRQEFLNYVERHKRSRDNLESTYTIIRRRNGRLVAIPFHKAYEDLLRKLTNSLIKVAKLEVHSAFRKFLIQRARDLRIDDFSASDALWVNLMDNPIDLAVGPHEVYEDELMGLKAAYEGILLKRDFEATRKLGRFQRELPKMCASLERRLGRSLAVRRDRVRISVAELAYAGGDAHAAIPAIAFTLPNDERTIEEVGTRQVILRNILEAKFRLVGWQILGRVILSPPIEKDLALQSFVTFTLLHEIAHSIGPHRIVKDGAKTTVNRCLKQHHSVLEETKAETLGACLTLQTISAADLPTFLKTYVGELVRPIRFGIEEAHGGSSAIQFNYLLRAGAIAVNATSGKIKINHVGFEDTLCALAGNVLTAQEDGDFDAADRLIRRFRVMSCELKAVMRQTQDLPLDIRVRFRSDLSIWGLNLGVSKSGFRQGE